jgi:hypothetical protein
MCKTDEIDTFIIADYFRFGRLPMSIVEEEQYVALQQLKRVRYHVIQQIKKEKLCTLQYLSYKCNTCTEEVDSSVFEQSNDGSIH